MKIEGQNRKKYYIGRKLRLNVYPPLWVKNNKKQLLWGFFTLVKKC